MLAIYCELDLTIFRTAVFSIYHSNSYLNISRTVWAIYVIQILMVRSLNTDDVEIKLNVISCKVAEKFAFKCQISHFFDVPIAFHPLYLENGFGYRCRSNRLN